MGDVPLRRPDRQFRQRSGLATGDGATTSFTLARALGGFVEPVGWATSVSQVSVGGAAQSSGWSLAAPNSLVFATPPASGAAIAASFAYAFLCRFDDDAAEFEQVMQNLWTAREPQVPFGALVMKTASPALIAFLNAARANPDAPIAFAECFAFTLATGTTLAYTNVDQPVVYNGLTFAADGPLVQGLKYAARSGSRSTSSRSPSPRGRPTSSPARRSSKPCATAPSTARACSATACS